MPPGRGPRDDPILLGFREVFRLVEQGKDAIAAAMPTSRRVGTPLAEAVHTFESLLADAKRVMPEWRARETESEWDACQKAIDDCLAAAERLRLEAPVMDFEQMALVLGDLIAPLDVFNAAKRVVRRSP